VKNDSDRCEEEVSGYDTPTPLSKKPKKGKEIGPHNPFFIKTPHKPILQKQTAVWYVFFF
jgi:hypothetical protein